MKIGTMTQFSNSYLAIVFDELKLMGLINPEILDR
jgi:hypothetical protein